MDKLYYLYDERGFQAGTLLRNEAFRVPVMSTLEEPPSATAIRVGREWREPPACYEVGSIPFVPCPNDPLAPTEAPAGS
jgi:hypothetical protein